MSVVLKDRYAFPRCIYISVVLCCRLVIVYDVDGTYVESVLEGFELEVTNTD